MPAAAAATCSEIYWILGKADSLFREGRIERSLEEYRDAFEKNPDPLTRQAALLGVGRCLVKLGRLDDAALALQKALDLEVSDCEQDGSQSYRLQVQWDLGLVRIQTRDYALALQAFRDYRAIPKQFFCGLGPVQEAYNNDLYEGLCQEGLGHYPEAIGAYFRASDTMYKGAAHTRIAHLFMAAGQERDLEVILRERDRRCAEVMARYRRSSGRAAEPGDAECWSSRRIREILRIHELGKRGDREALVDLIVCPDRDKPRASGLPCDFIEASEALARRPNKSAPLLLERLRTTPRGPDRLILQALGRCGTDEAVATLTTYARREVNSWVLLDVTHALWLAGPKGEAALAALAAGATDNLKWTIGLWRAGRLESSWRESRNLEVVAFPKVPRGLRLPTHLD